jgi:chromatin remodeling complex protein RSC6
MIFLRRSFSTTATAAAAARIQRPVLVSEALQSAIGLQTTTRGNALKLLWAYIKEKKLQKTDASGKSVISADTALSKVFSKPEIKITEVMGELSKHLKTIDEVKPVENKAEKTLE